MNDLFEEMQRQLEALDNQQAMLQAHSYPANRYARWCDGMFAELDNERIQLEKIMREYQEVYQLYVRCGGMG